MKLTPYLHFAGNAEEALNFYKDALGGEIIAINRYGNSPVPSDEDYKDKIMHSRLVFGDNLIMISDSFKGNAVSTKGNIQLSIEADSAEQINTLFEKMGAGGTVTMPLQRQFWGATFGMLVDKFGVAWMFNFEDKK
jgi:PhnB protein